MAPRIARAGSSLRPRGIRTELALAFVGVTFGALVVAGLASWGLMSDILRKRMGESVVLTLRQIDMNISSLLGDIEDISLFTIANRNVRSFLRLDASTLATRPSLLLDLSEEFANLTTSKGYVANIAFRGRSGLSFETAGPSTASDQAWMAGIEASLPSDGSAIVTQTYDRRWASLGVRHVISFMRRLRDINDLSSELGILRIDVDEARIAAIYAGAGPGKTGYIFVARKDGLILSHPDKSRLSASVSGLDWMASAFQSPEGFRRVFADGHDRLLVWHASAKFDFIVIGSAPFGELAAELPAVSGAILAALAIAAAAGLALAWGVAARVTGPILSLTSLMKQVEGGDLGARAVDDRVDELGDLSRGFNSMVAEIERLISEVYENSLRRKDAELRALESQVNPHFLYNTLDVLYWTSRIEGAPRTGNLVAALSRLFRLGLNGGEEMTTVRRECEHLQSYLAIQRVRYDEPPAIDVAVAEDILDLPMLKLVLQPLAENAFVHGIADLGSGGRLRVEGMREGKALLFRVSDNGAGMDDATILRALGRVSRDGRGGHGLATLKERIELHFGAPWGLRIESEAGKGTVVEVRLPLVGEAGS